MVLEGRGKWDLWHCRRCARNSKIEYVAKKLQERRFRMLAFNNGNHGNQFLGVAT